MSQSQYELDYNLQENDNIIELIPKLRLDIVKEIYEFIGYDLGKTDNECDYKNYLINNPGIFGGFGMDGEYGVLGVGGGSSAVPISTYQHLNVAAFAKYASGGYLNNIQSAVNNRTINFSKIPANFIAGARQAAQSTGVPLGFFILVGSSESGFRDAPTNSSGYGGYFGQVPSKGYGQPFEVQAQGVTESWRAAKRYSPGAGYQELLVLGYIYHHLPAVGMRYWKQTGGKIYSVDPDFIMNNTKACYGSGTDTRYAEAVLINVSAQYMAAQICQAGL